MSKDDKKVSPVNLPRPRYALYQESTVIFSWDLTPYIDAARKYCASATLDEVWHQKIPPKLRKHYVDEVSGVSARSIWLTIQKTFVTLPPDKTPPSASSTKRMLAQIKPDISVAFDSLAGCAMNDGCHELIKNSMDALIVQSLDNPRKPTILEVTFGLNIIGDSVCLTVTDNAGGFPDALLKRANEHHQCTMQETGSFPSTKDSHYLFGGNGRGLKGLEQLILYGLQLGHHEHVQCFDIPTGSTAIDFSNVSDAKSKGAKITIKCPVSPPLRHQPAVDNTRQIVARRVSCTPKKMTLKRRLTPLSLEVGGVPVGLN